MSTANSADAATKAQTVRIYTLLKTPPNLTDIIITTSTTTTWLTLMHCQHLHYPCGLIRGALASLGITATVQAECTDLPSAVFQIKTIAGATNTVGGGASRPWAPSRQGKIWSF
jgi:Transport protein particle (TRAPP) component